MEPSIFLPKPQAKKAKVTHVDIHSFRNQTMHAPETSKVKWHPTFIKYRALPQGIVNTTYDDPAGVVVRGEGATGGGCATGDGRPSRPAKPASAARPSASKPLPPRGECRWLAIAKRNRSPSPEPRPQAADGSQVAGSSSLVAGHGSLVAGNGSLVAGNGSSLESAKALVKSIHEQMISNSRCIVRSSSALTSGRHDIRSSLQALRNKVSFAQGKLKEYTKNGGSLVIDGQTYTQFDVMFASHGPLGSYGIGILPFLPMNCC